MKKIFSIAFVTALVALLTVSCDVIDQPFKGGTIDTTTTTQQLRNVLIEDFTGHRCKNCPKASKKIEELVTAFGSDRIIGLAIHAGPGNFTNTTADYPTDFTTNEGKQIQNFFGTNFLPVGMVNRENWTASGNAHWSGYSNWPTLSAEAMDSTLRVALNVEATLNDTTLTVTTEALPQVTLLHDLKYVVLVKESGIVSPQLLPDATRDPDYVHNNVLRAFVTDLWGETLGTSPLVTSDVLNDTQTMTWNNDWVKDNSAVVVYAFNPENYRILQVVEVAID